MTDLLPFLKKLISAPGISGHEAPARKIIEEAWSPLVDQLSVSQLGSLHGLRRGTGPEPRQSILIAAHMDAVGLMVTRVQAGFLQFTDIGGADPRVLPGQPVTVYGREELPGIIVQPPARLLPPQHRDEPTPMQYLWIDTGLAPEQAAKLVRPGDLVSFAQPPFELSGETLAGHTLDNRASVAALTYCLDELTHHAPLWDVYAVATVQEEISYAGAYTSAYQLQPSLAVAVDVTFGAGPGSPSHQTHPLGKGIVLGYGPNIHPALFKAFKELADRLEIPYSIEAIPGGSSGTDATALQVTSEGFPSMVLSIPLRYMHTPLEVVSIKDIQRAGRLLAGFIAGLDGEFMQTITWEE